jgi:hypothetical protein
MPARVVAPTRVNGCRSSLTVLERRIENFLDHRRQAVNFVDEQHVVRLEVGKERR